MMEVPGALPLAARAEALVAMVRRHAAGPLAADWRAAPEFKDGARQAYWALRSADARLGDVVLRGAKPADLPAMEAAVADVALMALGVLDRVLVALEGAGVEKLIPADARPPAQEGGPAGGGRAGPSG
jgi:hypothetical protein